MIYDDIYAAHFNISNREHDWSTLKCVSQNLQGDQQWQFWSQPACWDAQFWSIEPYPKWINISNISIVKHIWLVVDLPLWNILVIISQLFTLFPIYGKTKNVPNHQPDIHGYVGISRFYPKLYPGIQIYPIDNEFTEKSKSQCIRKTQPCYPIGFHSRGETQAGTNFQLRSSSTIENSHQDIYRTSLVVYLPSCLVNIPG